MVAHNPWDRAPDYFAAGYPPIYQPYDRKWPPPDGTTGYGGTDLTLDQIREHTKLSNIAIRLPDGVVGIDVDEHGKLHPVTREPISGTASLAELVAEAGELPATFVTQGNPTKGAGIRLFRVPKGRKFRNPAPGIDVIQPFHRYVMVAPSLHPHPLDEFCPLPHGHRYVLLDPDGQPVEMLPHPDSLPALPPAWVELLSAESRKPGRPRKDFRAYTGDVPGWLALCHDPDGKPLQPGGAVGGQVEGRAVNGACRHDAARDGVMSICGLAVDGHIGGRVDSRLLASASQR